jgi:hypothetical protein|tara:strand:- start:336 stop:1304 length:969 start_codon:yes stop_codon:yes gene_type:complete
MIRTRGDIFISIRSRDLISTSVGNFNNSGRFNLFENIIAEEDEILAVELVSATIPNSFYNLSNNNANNTLTFSETGFGEATITIPSGSYNILEITEKIKTLMEAESSANMNGLTYTFSYDEINNLLTITNSNPTVKNTTFNFTTNTSCRRFLGFSSNSFTINSTNGITSDRAVDITDTRNSIFIRLPNLSNNKIVESSSGKYSNIIAQVPVVLSRNTFFTFDPPTTFKCELAQKQINSIDILITYQEETNGVNFENADWEINLMISFFKAPKSIIEERRKEHSLHAELRNRVKNYYDKTYRNLQEQQELNNYFKENLSQIKT